jgi:hypothetical protein
MLFTADSSTASRDRIVRELLRDIDGIAEVLVRERTRQRRAKVFVVLATHDLRRDDEIVRRLCELDDIAMDLVAATARALVPTDAKPFALS